MFAYRLAAKLGYVNVDEMLGSLSSRQFSEWMAFYNLDPFDDARADIRSGIVASTIANAFRSKSSRAARPSDFMINFDSPRRKPQSTEQMKQIFDAFLAAANKRKKKTQKGR